MDDQPTTRDKRLLFRRGALLLLVLAFTVTDFVGHRYDPNVDFNIYYYATVVQHHGSYTNTIAALELARKAHHHATAGGAYGAPPLIALVFEPLTLFNQLTALIIWRILAFSIVLVGIQKVAPEKWTKYLCVIAVSPAFLLGIYVGNASTIIFGLIAYAIGAFRKHEDTKTGIALGLAVAFKVYPAFLILVFLLTGRRRAFLSTLCTVAITWLATLAVLGPEGLREGTKQLLAKTHGQLLATANSSLPGNVYNITSHSLAASLTNIACFATAICVLILLRHTDPARLLAVAVGFMILSQSISWDHYFAMGVLVLIAILEYQTTRMVKLFAILAYCCNAQMAHVGEEPIRFLPSPGIINAFGLIVLVAIACVLAKRTLQARNAQLKTKVGSCA